MKARRPAVLAAMLLPIIGCEEPDPYPHTAATALRVNAGSYHSSKHASTVVDTFGAPGPYRWAGGYVGNPGVPVTYKVKVDGVWEKRPYEPGEDEFFHAQAFENEAGDGYMIVRKAVILPDGDDAGPR